MKRLFWKPLKNTFIRAATVMKPSKTHYLFSGSGFLEVLFFIIFLCMIGVLPVYAEIQSPKGEIYTIFSEANQAFNNANSAANNQNAQNLYSDAILRYEKLINDHNIKNPGLYYNLANAYFLNGNIGKAILNYRRAQDLQPGNTDIQKNLSFARAGRMDKIELKTREKVLKTLLFWHYDFTIKTRFFVSSIAFAMMCLSLLYLIWRRKNNLLITTSVICGLLFICLFGSVLFENIEMKNLSCGVIIADEIIARQGDGENYMPSFKEPLHAGTEFELIENRDSWLHIELADTSKCWIKTDSAELI